ncbi:MAG: hypothetical protein R3326_04780 [Gemmatimonadota bacterium]|nr:hypothetical protein [Gemmatimonadota bacterium]
MPSDAQPNDLARSDDRVAGALEALAESRADFRSAVAEAIDTVTAILDARGSAPEERVTRTGAELGAFAEGRIDAEAFAGLSAVEEALDPAAVAGLESARETLRTLAGRGQAAFVIDVERGADLRNAVATAFAELGRAFAAGRLIEAIVERRREAKGMDADAIEPLAFRQWTAAERAIAPPMVVAVDGTDLVAAGLAEFLDGAVKIVLVVRGESTPAPLVRLVSPSVTVVQTADPDGLEAVAAATGPGIAALVSEETARFLHDPAGGDAFADRLTVEFLPEKKPRARLAGASAFQQAEELRLLAALAGAGRPALAPETGVAEGIEAAPALPADRLAAWLLSRADLTGVDPGNGSGE